jgi:hypothetical protein
MQFIDFSFVNVPRNDIGDDSGDVQFPGQECHLLLVGTCVTDERPSQATCSSFDLAVLSIRV